MTYSTLIIALLLTGGFHLELDAAAAPPDGQRFAIDLKEGEKPQGQDAIVFAAGKGDCLTAGAKYKYEKGAYTSTKTAQGMAVTFTMKSVNHGQLVITATITGDTISGSRTWSKPDKKPLVHQFIGIVAR